MGDLKIKKVCGFNISSIHFSMMILPYIKKELETKKDVITILEENLEKNINQILSKLTITEEEKEKILNINWKETDIKESSIQKNIREKMEGNDNLDIIVYGSEQYINCSGEIINKILDENVKKNKNIKIIDCYSINDFNENIKEILNNHDIMFNTSGEHKIEEIFEGYKFA